MAERVLCLDTSVLIKYLSPDEPEAGATSLVENALRDGVRLIAPSWSWAEIGSVLRKKVRARMLQPDDAQTIWTAFLGLPIEFIDTPPLRARAWEIAGQYQLPTLYDATFLACTELALAPASAAPEFWTADEKLLQQLGSNRPTYVHRLGQ